MVQTDTNIWLANNVYQINEKLDKLKFAFEADVYIEKPLSSYLNMGKSVAGLFNNGKYTDFIVSVKNWKFKCHKAMLMEKSPVFEDLVRIFYFL